jgi:hypothetical protein
VCEIKKPLKFSRAFENAVTIKSNNGTALTGGLIDFPKLSNLDDKTKLYLSVF